MKPSYQDNDITNYNKSCLSMTEVADETVQCCVTSPPYWGLRIYAGDTGDIWGRKDFVQKPCA